LFSRFNLRCVLRFHLFLQVPMFKDEASIVACLASSMLGGGKIVSKFFILHVQILIKFVMDSLKHRTKGIQIIINTKYTSLTCNTGSSQGTNLVNKRITSDCKTVFFLLCWQLILVGTISLYQHEIYPSISFRMKWTNHDKKRHPILSGR